jgi:putative ABC transport system permease protein
VRTLLVVAAVALAVLSTTLLAGVGIGALETGAEKFEQTDQDIWVSGGATRIAPGSVGGFENAIVDSHAVTRQLQQHEGVAIAAPMAFQTVYVGAEPSDLRTVVGVGVPNAGPRVLSISEGERFSSGDTHYAGGSYDGPMTQELIIDPRTAALFDVGVGDTLYVGGTVASARANEYEIVGISSTFTQLLGAPSVALHLSELQTLTGTAVTDRAGLITIAVADGADPEVVASELEAEYPEYEFRTNREQLQTVLEGQAVVLAGASVLVLLAILAGVALTLNALALLVYQQREALAALKAGGVSSRTLWWTVVGQALLVGLAGGVVGLALTPVAVMALNEVALAVVGFEGLVQTRAWVYGLGAAIAIWIGLVGSGLAGWRLMRIRPLPALR